jgi:hypothetical protein
MLIMIGVCIIVAIAIATIIVSPLLKTDNEIKVWNATSIVISTHHYLIDHVHTY